LLAGRGLSLTALLYPFRTAALFKGFGDALHACGEHPLWVDRYRSRQTAFDPKQSLMQEGKRASLLHQ